MEIWKPIKGYEERYQVSNLGRIKSCYQWNGKQFVKKERILIPSKNKVNGYMYVHLINKCYSVHRLVAIAFIPNPLNKTDVNHKDYDRTNNCVDNLEWLTRSENNLWSSERMGKARKGIPAWNKGIPCSEEAKKKLSLAKKGKKWSDKRWEVYKRKSGTQIGNARPVYQYDLNGNFIKKYDYMRKAVEENPKLIATLITKCCRNKRKSHGGFIWKYNFE